MDVVITYVNGLDPVWQADYAKYVGEAALSKRYRDWGTLKYLLRGIETHIPSVQNVFLVVHSDSQVPEWVDTENLRIVRHSDIIPAEYLPTFNSTTIEMFLHRIPGLDEKYLYFNDDIFPVMKSEESDFFPGGIAAMGFSRHLLALSQYHKQCRNSDRLARKAAGRLSSPFFVVPQHICSTMLKSDCERVFEMMKDEILSTLTRLREPKNLNQKLFLDYSFHTGHAISRRLSRKHISLAVYTPEQIAEFLRRPTRKLVCINDVELDEKKFEQTRKTILDAFEEILPTKSRFEK